MVWLHPALLFGLGLVIVPVLLHLLMRAKPKKLIFPALRLIQNRKRTNVRRLRLRHWALLLLRMAALALLVLAVARPSVPATDYSLARGDWLRLVLVALVSVGVYFGLLAWWKRRHFAAHELAYRRSLLRAGLGAAGLMALLLLVAWPYQRRISAAITQPTLAPSEFLPVAAVMVFDTSLSMQYRHENRTRLEIAQEIATRHIGALPRLSRVAVCETAADAPIRLQSDLAASVRRISSLAVQPLNRPLEDRLLAAVEAQLEDHERHAPAAGSGQPASSVPDLIREIYVFTDLAAGAWRTDESPRLKEALERLPTLGVYFIDVGVTEPTNIGLTTTTLSEQSAPRGTSVTLRASLQAAGIDGGERVVELHTENDSGKMVKQDQRTVKLDRSAATMVEFPVRVTGGAVVQGELRILGSDPMPFDDARGFTIQTRPAVEVLVCADNAEDTIFLTTALVYLGEDRYRFDLIAPAALTTSKLQRYSVVWLVNVADPGPAAWKALTAFANRGGRVAVALGDRVAHEKYLTPDAREFLPAELQARSVFSPPEYFDMRATSNSAFRFDEWGDLISMPINECWRVAPVERDVAVLARFTDHGRVPAPAIVEKALGDGRVLMVTTSLDRQWSDPGLPTATWFIVLIDRLMQHLDRAPPATCNYTIGENVSVALDPEQSISAFLLKKPGLQQLRQEVPAGARSISVHEVDQLGNYRLTGAEAGSKFERGFSVNAAASESNLTRLMKSDLDARLGSDRCSVARDIANLQKNVRAGRLGREAFPFVAVFLLAVFLGEHFLANRFYEQEQQPAT